MKGVMPTATKFLSVRSHVRFFFEGLLGVSKSLGVVGRILASCFSHMAVSCRFASAGFFLMIGEAYNDPKM